MGSILLKAPRPDAKADPITDSLPFIILPLRNDDTQWIAALTATRHAARQVSFTPEILATIRTTAPAAVWQIRLGARKQSDAVLVSAGNVSPANARLKLSTGIVQLEFRDEEGQLKEQTSTARKRFAAQVAECDANSDGILDEHELGTPKAGQLKQLARISDRNEDGKLSEQEFQSCLQLQEQIAKGYVLLTVLDHGTGLFEFLDADHDAALSVRELRSTWSRLKAAGCITAGHFDRTKLPRQLIAALSQGRPRTLIGKTTRQGPNWFQAMDRNGDGEVSQHEFTGSAKVFNGFDRDQDGLITSDETVMIRK